MYYPAGAEFDSSSESEDDFYPTPFNARPTGRESANAGWTPSAIPWTNSSPANNNNNQRQDVTMDSPDLQKMLERTKKSLRSVLMAEKDNLALSMLEKEYYDMYEESIPWRRLLFSSLEDFLRSIPSVCRVTNIGFSAFVSAVTDQNTHHIRQMVAVTKKKGKKGGGGGGGRGGRGFPPSRGYQSYRPPPTPAYRGGGGGGGVSPADQTLKERTEKLIKSTLNTSKIPMSFTVLEKEFLKFYQEEIPWRRLGFSSLEKFLRALPGTCRVSGSSVSSVSSSQGSVKSRGPSQPGRPVPVAVKEKVEEKEEKERLPETSEQSVWVGRLKTLLAARKFGMLLVQMEKMYEKDWAESLPSDWRVRLGDIPGLVISDDGLTPPVIKLSPAQSVEPPVDEDTRPGQQSGKIREEPR